MKNKKLIATVASLCLIVVAVVAAVVGVLAAAQQNVANKVKVSYIANNVNADVTIMGRTEAGTFANTTSDKTYHFAPQDVQITKTLTSDDIALSWGDWDSDSDTPLTLNRYAVYQFKFENKSATRQLEVKLTYTTVREDNVTLRWYKSTEATLTPTISYTPAGVLENTTDTLVTLNGQTAVLSGDNIIAANGTGYIYLVVAITNLNSDAHFGLGASETTETYYNNTLVFELNSIVA